jgi:hypothetical protein
MDAAEVILWYVQHHDIDRYLQKAALLQTIWPTVITGNSV